MRALCPVAAAASLVAAAQADQILLTHNASLTSYLPSSATGVQDVRPLLTQRGVGLDGTLRMGGAFGWAMAANPFESELSGARLGDVRLASGHYAPMEIDIALPAQVPWVIGRTYNAVQETSGGAHRDSDGYQGKNWFQISQPELVFFDNDGMVAKEEEDMLYLVYGADRFLEFRRTADNADTFRGVNGTAGVIELQVVTEDSVDYDTLVYYDQRGNRTTFFGIGDGDIDDDIEGQIWKIEDPAGNVAYVGDQTDLTDAMTNGYDAATGEIDLAFDSAGRRYCYTYTAIDSVSRLTKVTARTGATTCDNGTIVGQVDYAYYQTSDNTHGDNGNLKLVTITTPLSDSNDLERNKYYRYYKGAYNSSSNPGHANTIKLVIGFEGTRNYDWSEAGAGEPAFDQGYESETDANLEPYADAYFEYTSDYLVSKVFFNGECGCGGGSSDGEHVLTYQADSGFSNSAGYDEEWKDRVVIDPPTGGVWATQYFDETGQPLSRVLTDGDPSSGSPNTWVTEFVRNSNGQVSEVHTPANVTGYTHDSMGNPDGTITTSGSAGLVWYLERVASGDGAGLLQGRRQLEGDTNLSTSSEYVSWRDFELRSLNIASGVNVTRPVVDDTREYHTATTTVGDTSKYDETTRTQTWWDNTTNTNVEYIALKQVDISAPAVGTGQNGSGSATVTSVYYRKDGTVAFVESARGIVTSTQLTNGQVTKRIEDADTDTGTTYPSGEHPFTDFGIAQTTAGFHRVTDMTYDAQGRLSETTLPTGRVTFRWYTQLEDERMVTFDIPRKDGSNYHGPAKYTVSNHTGKAEDRMTVAVSTPATAPSGWLDTSGGLPPEDPIDAFVGSVGSLTHVVSMRYDSSGAKLTAQHAYFDVPSTMASAVEGTHYDETTFAYDNLGRRTKTTDPTGTIRKTDYDALSRVTAAHVGTDDSGGGSDDMVKVTETVYDSGNDGGNSYVTQRTDFVVDGTTSRRDTTYENDYRGRMIVTNNPQAPHAVAKYDNLDRVVAVGQYSANGSLTISTDPTSTTGSRVALSQTFYDERGQVWKTQRHEITQSTGADADNLQTLNWYDPDGRLIKTDGDQLTKTRFDRLGREIQRFTLANDNDGATTYSDVYNSANLFADLAGDRVLKEVQKGYDGSTDLVLVTAAISRDYNDTSTTGPLDTTYDGGDNDALQFLAANVNGRIQITGFWYDEWDRRVTTASYGTNDATDNVATFDRDGLTEPTSSSSSRLVRSTAYNDDGTVLERSDSSSRETRFLYDDARRVVAEIRNYTGGSTTAETRDNDLYTRYAYADGLRTHAWVDQQADDTNGVAPTTFTGADANDQVTTYTYGTSSGTPGSGSPVQSAIATGHLLYQVTYPDNGTVTYAYNAQAQQVYMKDQEGNVIETDFDTGGRETDRKITILDMDFDGAVRRITTAYTSRGFVQNVTQYDAATGGNLVDDVEYTYDGWGNLTSFIQDVDSEIGGSASGRASFQVDYTYAKNTGGRNTIRRTEMDLPGSTEVLYSYLSASGRLDNDVSRVSRVRVRLPGGLGSTTVDVADYEYLGAGFLVGTDLAEAEARWELFEGGTGTDPYPDLDRYNRVTDSRWTGYKNSGTRDFYDVDITYGSVGNYDEIIAVADNVHKTAAGNRNYDVAYTRDALGRMIRAEEGSLTFPGGVPTIGNRSRDEQWRDSSSALGLSQTGSWEHRRLDINGNGTFSDSGDFDETNTFNGVNELIGRNTDSSGGDEFTLTYDVNGNLTDDGEDYEYVWDPFGRLRKVLNTSNQAVVAEYRYNGLGFRIGWHYDTTDSMSGGPDGTVDANDPWFYFAYDDNWRMVSTFRASDTNPKEVFVHHNAGMDGMGGSSYIDAVILRDRDANTTWHAEADATREERVYYCQNWRSDVSVLLTDDGKLLEWIKYSPYGMPIALPAGDTDSDGDWDATDSLNISLGGSDVRRDTELDGDADAADTTHANSITGGYQTLGRDKLSSTGVESRRGYAGYEYDPTFNGADRHLYHVRNRVCDAEVGRWIKRDPLGYIDGMSMYEYVRSRPLALVDPAGLTGEDGGGLIEDECVVERGLGLGGPLEPDRGVSDRIQIAENVSVRARIRFIIPIGTNPNPTPAPRRDRCTWEGVEYDEGETREKEDIRGVIWACCNARYSWCCIEILYCKDTSFSCTGDALMECVDGDWEVAELIPDPACDAARQAADLSCIRRHSLYCCEPGGHKWKRTAEGNKNPC